MIVYESFLLLCTPRNPSTRILQYLDNFEYNEWFI